MIFPEDKVKLIKKIYSDFDDYFDAHEDYALELLKYITTSILNYEEGETKK